MAAVLTAASYALWGILLLALAVTAVIRFRGRPARREADRQETADAAAWIQQIKDGVR
jgi:hypothetical protein